MITMYYEFLIFHVFGMKAYVSLVRTDNTGFWQPGSNSQPKGRRLSAWPLAGGTQLSSPTHCPLVFGFPSVCMISPERRSFKFIQTHFVTCVVSIVCSPLFVVSCCLLVCFLVVVWSPQNLWLLDLGVDLIVLY